MSNKSIDRELIQSIDLELIASDNRPALSSTSTDSQQADASSRLAVHIQVTDINDNIPRFILSGGGSGGASASGGEAGHSGSGGGGGHVINVEFDEGLPANSHLLTLKAHDPDVGANAQIRYELVVDKEYNDDNEIERTFRLDALKGELYLRRKLELAERSMGKNSAWQLSVRARDVASGKYALAIVNLKMNDVNNHAPDVSLSFFFISR